VVRFLHGVLHLQDRFPQHYADSLDGCGLYLENSVRGAFYTIVRRLLDIIRPVDRSTLTRSVSTADCNGTPGMMCYTSSTNKSLVINNIILVI
jgi:hypothetical protein